MRRPVRITFFLGALLFCSVTRAKGGDHLVPIFDSLRRHRELYEQKLFTTPGEVARFVHLPPVGQELCVSIHKGEAKVDGHTQYWVTVTQPTRPLSDYFPTGDEKFTGRHILDPRSIRVLRKDALLPEQTANAIHELWLTMLRRTAPDADAQAIVLDTSIGIFAVTDPDGHTLQAQIPKRPEKYTKALLETGFMLADYVRSPAASRPSEAHAIETRADQLTAEVHREK